MKKQLVISTSIDLVRIAPEKIVYIASDGNYSTLVQTDNEVRMLSFQLGFTLFKNGLCSSHLQMLCVSLYLYTFY